MTTLITAAEETKFPRGARKKKGGSDIARSRIPPATQANYVGYQFESQESQLIAVLFNSFHFSAKQRLVVDI